MILRRPAEKNPAHSATQNLVRAAFTLMEMLIVVAIIVALAGMGGYYFLGQLSRAKENIARAQITELTKACETYKTDHGQWPPSLQALAQKTDGLGPYLKTRDALKDPWGKDYQYDPNGSTDTGADQPEISTQSPDAVRISNIKR